MRSLFFVLCVTATVYLGVSISEHYDPNVSMRIIAVQRAVSFRQPQTPILRSYAFKILFDAFEWISVLNYNNLD